MSFSADIISQSMKIPVEEICDVIGYPKDKEGRVKAYKDYNYYDHGEYDKGDRLAEYILFLQEGDFEKYQPACYMDKTCNEFLNLRQEASHIPITDNHIMEARRYWILMRFPKYQGTEWGILREKFIANTQLIPEWVKIHETISQDKMLSFFM